MLRRFEVLKAEQRLRRSVDYQMVVRRGIRVGRPTMVIYLLPTSGPSGQGAGPAAVGLVVGRTVGGAVVRNAVRRRLRHLMSDRMDLFPAGTRLVVRALPGAAAAPSSVLGRELDAAIGRAISRAEKRR